MNNALTVLNVSGPYREPREPVFSYDYAIQRPNWPTPHGVRIKVSIPEELEYLKSKVLGLSGGTPGQQLLTNRDLSRRIADRKLQIADDQGMLSQRQDVLIDPFTETFAHLFLKLEEWMRRSREELREEVRQKAGI